ncbi:hypothetical protein CRUP_015083 [Coryphaenoides rupestris]|nr:hypothetical protein CRUP_015083 [Coryphaenoides rupestris]
MAVRTLGGCGLFRPNRYHKVPDGGWGWLVAGAFFLVEVFTYGTIKSFGIFLQDLVEEFEESNSKPVVMLGGALIATGTISTAFTSSINQMYITTGVVAGLGYCLTFLPTVTLLSQYFDRRRALVTAVASMGESFAMFALAPAFAALRDHVGWRHTLVVMGALQASIIACGALLRPIIVITPSSPATAKTTGDSLSSQDSGVQSLPEDKMEDTALKGASEEEEVKREEDTTEKSPLEAAWPKTKTKLLDFSILREGSFICYSLFGLFATMGFFAPPLYIIELSVSRHVERDRATYMLSVMAVAEVLGRLAVGGAMTRPRLRGHKLRVLLGCVMAMALVLLGFTLVQEFYGLAVCCAAYGFFMGAIACTHIPLLAEDQVVGIQRMASAAGVYLFNTGLQSAAQEI